MPATISARSGVRSSRQEPGGTFSQECFFTVSASFPSSLGIPRAWSRYGSCSPTFAQEAMESFEDTGAQAGERYAFNPQVVADVSEDGVSCRGQHGP